MVDRLISIDTAKDATEQLPVAVRAELDAFWASVRDALLVHKAAAETITGQKTFTAKTFTKDVEITPPTAGATASLRLNNGAGQVWEMGSTAAALLALLDVTNNRVPFSVAANAITNALRILASTVQLGVDLDLASHNLLNVGNVNVANGLLQLDGNGRVPTAQLTVDAMQWKGTWNASTNSPTLADGTGSPGDTYRVTVAGTQNLGSGSQTFDVGDWVILSEASVWQKADMTDAVASVAGLTGAITASSLRTALSLVVGTNVQAWDADLDAIAALTAANDDFLQRKSGVWINRTPTQVVTDLTTAGLPYDLSYLQTLGTRAVGSGSNALGVRIPRACKFTEFAVRFGTADASGSTTVNVYKNGAAITPTAATATVASGSQSPTTPVLITAGGPWSFAAGDILNINISAIGTTPGSGLVVYCKGVTA